jgi:phage gp36-like protein
MGYCSIDDVIHEFTPELKASMQRDYGPSFEENLAGHIEKAEAFINASLSRAYAVPLSKASRVVVSAECKIAAYFATIAYSEKDEVVRDKYETATMMLDYLVEANNPALVDEGVSGEASPVDGILYGSDQRILSAEEIEKW